MAAVRNPAALAAWIGRHKYGASRFARMGRAGRKRKGARTMAPGGGGRFAALKEKLGTRR